MMAGLGLEHTRLGEEALEHHLARSRQVLLCLRI